LGGSRQGQENATEVEAHGENRRSVSLKKERRKKREKRELYERVGKNVIVVFVVAAVFNVIVAGLPASYISQIL
jgi:uncharacterized membrane protein SpoIIM required for sporulation